MAQPRYLKIELHFFVYRMRKYNRCGMQDAEMLSADGCLCLLTSFIHSCAFATSLSCRVPLSSISLPVAQIYGHVSNHEFLSGFGLFSATGCHPSRLSDLVWKLPYFLFNFRCNFADIRIHSKGLSDPAPVSRDARRGGY